MSTLSYVRGPGSRPGDDARERVDELNEQLHDQRFDGSLARRPRYATTNWIDGQPGNAKRKRR